MKKNTPQVKKRCLFHVESETSDVPNGFVARYYFGDYQQTKKGKIKNTRSYSVHQCDKTIYVERGGAPLCEEHYSQELADKLKEQRKLKRLYETKPDIQADRGEIFSGGFKTGALLITPGLVLFLLIFLNVQDSYSAMVVSERGVWNGWGNEITSEYYDTGRTISKPVPYPVLRKFLIWIWLCIPIYYLLFALVDDKPIFESIVKSIAMLVIGFIPMYIVYFVIGLFLTGIGA